MVGFIGGACPGEEGVLAGDFQFDAFVGCAGGRISRRVEEFEGGLELGRFAEALCFGEEIGRGFMGAPEDTDTRTNTDNKDCKDNDDALRTALILGLGRPVGVLFFQVAFAINWASLRSLWMAARTVW